MKRKVAPQWGLDKDGESIGNLTPSDGTKKVTFEVEVPLPTRDEITAMLDKSTDAFMEIVGGQFHIKFTGPVIANAVRKQVELDKPRRKTDMTNADGSVVKAETVPEYLVRTYDYAKSITADVIKGLTFEPLALFNEWVDETYLKRGEGGDKRPVLMEYDATENTVRTKWATASNTGRETYIKRLGLELTVMCSAEEFVAAMAKKYQRPISKELGELA